MTEPSQDRVRTGIRDAFRRIAPEVDLESIDPSANLREEADLDSVDALNLIVLLDENLGVEIPESDYDQITTLADMRRYLTARIPGG
ncbi:MAG: acyl carrier protein [Gemmatimonadales bacterium]|nr:MAG: acyl carrier protein [Gemmatimonadales bacterium]